MKKCKFEGNGKCCNKHHKNIRCSDTKNYRNVCPHCKPIEESTQS